MSALPRVLIVRVGAMGDVLHALPAVTALRAAMPQLHIGWAIEPRWLPLLACQPGVERGPNMPVIDTAHLVETRLWSAAPFSTTTARSILALRRQLRAARYDLAIDLQGSVRSAVIARLSGAPRIVGGAHPREQPARLLYTARVTTTAEHVVQQAAQIVSGATGLELSPATSPLPQCPAAEAWAEEHAGNGHSRLAILAPTAGWGAKQWPVASFAQLARALHSEGYTVLLNTGSASDPVATEVLAGSSGAAHLLPCGIAQLTALLRRAAVLVAGDTGPLHLAAAVGCPVVALFGPTDPARTGPWSAHAVTLRSPLSHTSHKRVQQTEPGLAAIQVDEVLAAVHRLPVRSA